MAKLMAGKATRDFVNYRHPDIADEDYLGPKAIIDGQFKLVVHDGGKQPKIELFNLAVDPSEKKDLANQYPSKVQTLAGELPKAKWCRPLLNAALDRFDQVDSVERAIRQRLTRQRCQGWQ